MDEGIVSGGDYEQKAEKERRTHRGGRSDCGEQRVGRGVEWREWVKMTGKKDKLATAARYERGWSREKGSVKMGTPTVKKRTSAMKNGGAYNGILQWRQWRKA